MKGAVHVRGSATLLNPVQLAAESFMAEVPDVVVPVSGGGTGRGIRAVIDGIADLALASADIDEVLARRAVQQRVELAAHAIARDAIVPCVHPENPVGQLTTDQLRDVFSGAVTSWRDLGGPDRPIAVMSYDPFQGTFESWMALLMGEDKITPRARIVDTPEVVNELARSPDAIGYIASTRVNPTVKPLTINGVVASEATIRSGAFPLTRALSVVTVKNPGEATARFLAFLLDPAKGQRFLAQAGNVTHR
jgi:phosphate transport system substrate-binding protein